MNFSKAGNPNSDYPGRERNPVELAKRVYEGGPLCGVCSVTRINRWEVVVISDEKVQDQQGSCSP